MGKKASEPVDIAGAEALEDYLHCNHAVYMRYDDKFYYLTDVGENYWRAQDTSRRNRKNHFIDCSAIVPTVGEFMALPFLSGRTLRDVCKEATFYPSVWGEKDK